MLAVFGRFANGHVEVVWAPDDDTVASRCIWWFWYVVMRWALAAQVEDDRFPPLLGALRDASCADYGC